LPLISVVIPVYNGERTIYDAITSVLAQTFQDFELIVIDDGSQDSTTDILAAIHDPRLKVFSFENAGPSKSRNRGISFACGEYISFLDADDLWTPDKLVQDSLNKPTITIAGPCPDKSSEKVWPSFHCNN
jgi:glycosyltransferase involved in cell wall biosynthesis